MINSDFLLTNRIKMTFTELKEMVSEERAKARKEAEGCAPIIRSRGAYFTALSDDEKLTESDMIEFKGIKQLRKDIAYWKTQGATKFFIEGGFDAGESIRYFYDDYQPWVSDWSVEVSEKI